MSSQSQSAPSVAHLPLADRRQRPALGIKEPGSWPPTWVGARGQQWRPGEDGWLFGLLQPTVCVSVGGVSSSTKPSPQQCPEGPEPQPGLGSGRRGPVWWCERKNCGSQDASLFPLSGLVYFILQNKCDGPLASTWRNWACRRGGTGPGSHGHPG